MVALPQLRLNPRTALRSNFEQDVQHRASRVRIKHLYSLRPRTLPNGLPIKLHGPCSLKCRLKALDAYPFRYESRLGLVYPFANAAHVSCNAGSTAQHRLNKDERSALISKRGRLAV